MNTPVDPLSIDLSDLDQSGTTTVSSQSIDAGVSTHLGLGAGSSVEISLDASDGLTAVVECGRDCCTNR